MKQSKVGRPVRARRTAVMEPLCPRAMLSVTLLRGSELRITGTDQADRISVAATPFINALVVDDNNVRHYYALSALKTIVIWTGAGDDRVTVDPALNGMDYDCAIFGEAGNDTLTGSGGDVHVNGGDGNDKLRVYSTKSGELVGGNGRDCLYGADTTDTFIGGGGNDKVYGYAGKDHINTGLGNDTVDAGAGNDTVTDSGGRDSLHGGDGNDSVKGLGAASVYGGEGDDTLVGTVASGGAGNDAIYGSAAGDLLHGDDGNDLIRGGAGKDVCFGDGGNDAIFGGSQDDELHGGGGDDNLYGSDGHTDKNTDDDGHDAGLGEAGADWFESPHVWRQVDWREGADRPGQNKLSQDSSVGHYESGQGVRVLNSSGGILQLGGVNQFSDSLAGAGKLRLINVTEGTIQFGNIGNTTTISPTIISKSLGQGGWLSSGAWDVAQQKFVPVALTAEQRKPLRHLIIQLPKDWKVGEMIDGGNEIVYLRVSATQTISGTGSINVPTTTGGTANVPLSTPGLLDGVEAGRYRYLAVKRGSVIVSGGGTDVDVKQYDWTSALVTLPTSGEVRIAGDQQVHTLATTFSKVPTTVPANARGILVNDGAVWLPADGSSATFTAG